MKKFRKLFTFLLAAPLFLGSCIMNNGICYTHKDADKDGICDVCGAKVKVEPSNDPNAEVIPGNPCVTHVDHDLDGTCDVCGANMSIPAHDHVDGNPQDGKCDICGATMIICNHHNDGNGDGKCDNCGANMPLPTGDVTVYLVLSSVGLYNGKKGDDIPSMNLENTVALVLAIGSDLPGKDVVTHSYGSAEFDYWAAYDGAGAPTVYTKVPAVNNKVLYAQFVANGQTPVTPTPDPDPTIPEDTETWSFTLITNFTGGNWSDANADIYAYAWDDKNNFKVSKGAKVDNNTFTFTILASKTKVLFVRMPNGIAFTGSNWDDKWNQTQDLDIDHTKSAAQISNWDGSNTNPNVTWTL